MDLDIHATTLYVTPIIEDYPVKGEVWSKVAPAHVVPLDQLKALCVEHPEMTLAELHKQLNGLPPPSVERIKHDPDHPHPIVSGVQ